MAALAAPCAGAREAHVHFNIAPQPLSAALVDFAVQADVSISTPRAGLAAIQAPPISGVLTPEAALRRLLAQSGLTFERIDAVTFRIVPAAHAVQAARRAEERVYSHEIVVTAARRPRTLDRFAASVTVLDAARLEAGGARESNDLAMSAPGLSFTNLGPGRNKIVLRGLSDGAFTGRTESTIGIYVDDSRITYGAPDPDLPFIDVESVEILHGPQGALYGGGAMGGVLRIAPRAPDLSDWSGVLGASVDTTRDGGLGHSLRGVANAPILDGRLGVRVAAYRDETAGWLDNPLLGLRHTNNTLREGVRATALARMGDAWTAQARFMAQSIDSADSQYADRSVGDWRRSTHLLEPHDNDFALASFVVRGPTPFGEFSSTTSYLHHAFDSRFDATGAFTAFGVNPANPAAFDDDNTVTFFTEEARLTAVASPFPWSIGVFLSRGEVLGRQWLIADFGTAAQSTPYRNRRHDDVHEYALYGEASWPIARHVAMTFGARAFRSELQTRAYAQSAAPELADRFRGQRAQMGVAPQVQISYEPAPGAFYYVLAASGYRGGGFNTGAASLLDDAAGVSPAQPSRRYGGDTLWNYEAGFKRRFWRDRLRLHLAAFYQTWDNIQTDQLIADGIAFSGNVGDGQVFGTEVEAAFSPSERLELSAHMTVTDTRIERVNPDFPASPDSALPGAPHFLSGAALLYHRPLWPDATLRLFAGALYVGHSNITFSNQSVLDIGGYVDATVRAGVETQTWSAALYIDNAADTKAATFSYGNPLRFGSHDVVTPLRPMTVGFELARRF